MLAKRSLLAIGLGLVLGVACGDDDDGGDGEASLCRMVGETICAEACLCGDCAVASGTAAKLTFDDEAGCRSLYVELGCSEPDDTIDLEACRDDLAAPECLEDADGSSLFLPTSCQSMQ